MLAPREVPAYLSSIARFDHFFALRQLRPSETVSLLRGVLDFIDPTEMQHLLGWSLDDACRLAEIAFDQSAGRDMSVIRDDQITGGGIDAARWPTMRPHFVHDFGAANRDYAKPSDADKSDFGFKPLIQIHRKNLLLISTALCALAFFEAITRALRDAGYPRLDDDMGTAVERVVADALRVHGLNVTIQGGTYKMLDPQPMSSACPAIISACLPAPARIASAWRTGSSRFNRGSLRPWPGNAAVAIEHVAAALCRCRGRRCRWVRIMPWSTSKAAIEWRRNRRHGGDRHVEIAGSDAMACLVDRSAPDDGVNFVNARKVARHCAVCFVHHRSPPRKGTSALAARAGK